MDNEESHNPTKRQKIIGIRDLVEELEQNGYLLEIKRSARALCVEKQNAMAILKVKSCNGGEGFGIPFSRAWCGTEPYCNEFYPFGSIFLSGMELLSGILESSSYEPLDEQSQEALRKLLLYFCDKDSLDFVMNLKKMTQRGLNNELHLAVAVAEHLFGKLAVHSHYILDSGRKFSGTSEHCCQCGCRIPIVDKYGDTTIGHSSVWHGNIDILFGKSELPVKISDYSKSSGGRVSVEEKYEVHNNIEAIPTKHQTLAQTIVFSFLQKKKHPDLKHFMIPCIGFTATQVIFYFYDSRNDILLQSTSFDLVDVSGSVNFDAIVALWLVLNYKYLGTGPSDQLLNGPKSGFFDHVHDFIDIYQEFLSSGDVTFSENPGPFKPSVCHSARFQWSEELPMFNFLI